ncbi:MAG: Rrf2 family transcriptional regulator [Actinomycetota bacterium]
MDIALSKTADYVVRAALALAEAEDDGYMTIAQVAEEMSLPKTFTPQVLGMLARAGIAESKAGRGGGYRLTRRPRRITMLDVVEAAEGSLVNERCTMRGGPCRSEDRCAVHDTWAKAAVALRRSLARTTLAEIARADLPNAARHGEERT